MMHRLAVCCILLGLSGCGDGPAPSPPVPISADAESALAIDRDFTRFCLATKYPAAIKRDLAAAGWQDHRRKDNGGERSVFFPIDRSQSENTISLDREGQNWTCEVVQFSGDGLRIKAELGLILQDRGSMVSDSREPLENCTRFIVNSRRVEACSLNIQPHGVGGGLRTRLDDSASS